jgi:hypothetical protein
MNNNAMYPNKIFHHLYVSLLHATSEPTAPGILIYYVTESCVICLLSILLYIYASHHLTVVMYNYAPLV